MKLLLLLQHNSHPLQKSCLKRHRHSDH